MEARRLRALVIGGAAAATLGVAAVIAADPLPGPPPAPATDPVMAALASLEARAADDLARAQAAPEDRVAPVVAVTTAPPVTESTSS
jgi:hypothetical protein